jgi:hypothetical protein
MNRKKIENIPIDNYDEVQSIETEPKGNFSIQYQIAFNENLRLIMQPTVIFYRNFSCPFFQTNFIRLPTAWSLYFKDKK